MGGEFSDLVHDCAASRTRVVDQMRFAVRACSWGGRYPALMFATTGSDDESSLVMLASDGASLEVLFDQPPSQSLFSVFDGLLLEDFDAMFLEFSQ